MALLKNRMEAGRLLAELLKGRVEAGTVILALPRGGVPVAFEIAQSLQLPLEPLVVRKLGVPHYPEFAMGAIAAGGHHLIDRELVQRLHLSASSIAAVVERETRELEARQRCFPMSVPLTMMAHRPVLVVDDGMATGSTMLAVLHALRALPVEKITVAVPVLSREANDKVSALADALVYLHQPDPFDAVGQWYADFRQTESDEVRVLLERAQRLPVQHASAEPSHSH